MDRCGEQVWSTTRGRLDRGWGGQFALGVGALAAGGLGVCAVVGLDEQPIVRHHLGKEVGDPSTGLDTLRRGTPVHTASVRTLFFGNIDDDELPCVERIFTRLRASLQQGER